MDLNAEKGLNKVLDMRVSGEKYPKNKRYEKHRSESITYTKKQLFVSQEQKVQQQARLNCAQATCFMKSLYQASYTLTQG